jgi:hypothetical protein
VRLRLHRPQRVDTRGLKPFERAVLRFNTSDARRKVEGLTRTLGEATVSVGAAAGAAEEVRITVAWELTWYQWGVRLGDESAAVTELASGRWIGELDAAARQWNASLVDGGRIVLVAPRRRPGGRRR